MTRAELIALAAPTCQECGEPIERTEMVSHMDEDAKWRLRAQMVCPDGHRMIVQPLL